MASVRRINTIFEGTTKEIGRHPEIYAVLTVTATALILLGSLTFFRGWGTLLRRAFLISGIGLGVGVLMGSYLRGNPEIGKIRGKLTGSDHWRSITYKMHWGEEDHDFEKMPIDISDVEECDEHYRVPVYERKPCIQSTLISILAIGYLAMLASFFLFATNFQGQRFLPSLSQGTIAAVLTSCIFYYAILSILYNALRIPCVIVANLITLIPNMNKHGFGKALKDTLERIVKAIWLSLINIIRAPFYALAYNLAHLMTLCSPLNGRKLGALVEQDWNHQIRLHNAFSLAGGKETGCTPGDYNPFYLTRCYNEQAYVCFSERPTDKMTDEDLNKILVCVKSPGGKHISSDHRVVEQSHFLGVAGWSC